MNEEADRSRRRTGEIERLKQSLGEDTVAGIISGQLQEGIYPETSKAVEACINALNRDIHDKIFDLSGFYHVLNEYNSLLSPAEQISIKRSAESIIRDAIKIEDLESRERVYQAEAGYIANRGYELNRRYLISFPGNPQKQPGEWVVTEFRVYRHGEIHPVHGCRIKINGTPYAKAQYISLNADEKFTLTRI
ncbi:hypothetical protein IR083_07885 [Dysgonomonas sp. GY75]|uniref:hypothetical protein n=1 Tax=Dysgonomonas sp. GY75 TaxID=2780419 RepID=UPI001883EB4C|nr:hypothetical protein [Dysgonomonas sp. GY75]MBF0648737.1 hypothetical protein [Dysgonomonas sp. GY75]